MSTFEKANDILSQMEELSVAEWVHIFRKMYDKVKDKHPIIREAIRKDLNEEP